MRTIITATFTGISLSLACGPRDPADDGPSGTASSGETGTATTGPGEPTTNSMTTSSTAGPTDETYTSYDYTEPLECYFDEDCGPEMICGPGGCTPLPQLPACDLPLSFQTGEAPLTAANAFPIDVVPFDADADGDLDAAVVEREPAQVELFLNDGAGVFASAGAFEVGAGIEPVDGDAADVDNDGRDDVLVLSSAEDGALSILRSTGDQLAAPEVLPFGTRPSRMTLADADADGAPDLFVINHGVPALVIRFGNGDGFGPVQPWSSATYYSDVGVGDLVADPFLDIALAGSNSAAQFEKGNGDRTFTGYTSVGGVSSNPASVLELGDIEGGGLDVVVAKQRIDGGSLARWLRAGDGFGEPGEWFFDQAPDNLQLADVDADGELEAVVSGDGEPGFFVVFGLGVGPACSFNVLTADEEQLRTLAAGDVDGDGRADALSVGGDQLRIFLSRM